MTDPINDAPTLLDEALEKELKKQDAPSLLGTALEEELKKREELSKLNRNLALRLGIGSIALSGLATIFGILANFNNDIPLANFWRALTPITASVAGILQGTLLGYPVDKRAVFHRTLAAEASSMKLNLSIRRSLRTADHIYVQSVVDQLGKLQVKGATEEPETSDKITALTLEQINETLRQIEQNTSQLGKLN